MFPYLEIKPQAFDISVPPSRILYKGNQSCNCQKQFIGGEGIETKH